MAKNRLHEAQKGPAASKFGPGDFLNRELSWLEFNQRVLEEALDSRNPLLERVKFFCITSSNLDEFFEVRVAGIKQQIESDVVERSIDGLTATETFRAITRKVRRMVAQQYRCWQEELLPGLAENGIRFFRARDLNREDRTWVESYYRTQVRPVLTPLALDPAHPFPQLLNKSLNIIVDVQIEQGDASRHRLAVVQLPRVLPRLVKLPRTSSEQAYVFLGDVIGFFLTDLFPGTRIAGYWRFRVTRNSELYIDEEDVANLLRAVENELHNRRKGDAVRLEIEPDCPPEIRSMLLENLRLSDDDLYVADGPLNPTRLMAIYEGDHSPELRDSPFVAPVAPALRNKNVFAAIRARDILLHHPYENFSSVLDFLDQAADDPEVLAVKQTLYRTGSDSPIVAALMRAVQNGKQVTAVVELKARFDEARNIEWARRLEEAGVHVLYGLVGCKIHAKLCLVVRRDDDGLRRYVHLSTGNYNPVTARVYTDVGLLSCRPELGEDATNFFNLLTGICRFQPARKFLVSPFDMHARVLSLIQRETTHAEEGLPARIVAKMNSLVDQQVIEALYRAAQAGVKIDLIVRGTCCLRPGVKGVSDTIAVHSIVDRFLEHSRVFYFENACQPEVYVGSADWMPRNFFSRMEIVYPVEDGNLQERIYREVLSLALEDNAKKWMLQPDGSYARARPKAGEPPFRSQVELLRRVGEASGSDRANSSGRIMPVKLAPSPFEGPGKSRAAGRREANQADERPWRDRLRRQGIAPRSLKKRGKDPR